MLLVPSPADFFLTAAPYQEFEINDGNWSDVLRIEYFSGSVDVFCPTCGTGSVFQSDSRGLPKGGSNKILTVDQALEENAHVFFTGTLGIFARDLGPFVRINRTFQFGFSCSRDKSHRMEFLIRVTPDSISKVGQTPSLADLQTHGLKKYRKILGPEKWRELSRAVGLEAHGVGIGAFVYLRRIFENVIDRAHSLAKADPAWKNCADFQTLRMGDKVKVLADRLPEFLVRNSRIYPIMGKGVHELTDDECLAIFKPIQKAIELILDAEIEHSEKEAKTKEAQRALDQIPS
jgi:hypothetical protein